MKLTKSLINKRILLVYQGIFLDDSFEFGLFVVVVFVVVDDVTST